MSGAADDNTAGPRPRTQAAIGAGLLLLALALWLDAARLPPPNVVGVGPSAPMRLVAVLVMVVALAHLVAAWRRRALDLPAPQRGNHASLAWVMAALLGLIAALQLGGGFVLGSAWLFVGTARGFGEKISAKSVGIGAVLAALVYLFFTRVLSLALPAGPLERLLLS
ncbi:MAG TPA: tripartite tricarboxylate transporter TctB family protein [Burkholderiaceae bacterium]|nr:tripartite tricarboxylate transporter TctB family protein [Burkholderiaceae bacterium]